MMNFLDLLQKVLSVIYFLLGSAAFLKYLMFWTPVHAGSHSTNRSHKPRTQQPAPDQPDDTNSKTTSTPPAKPAPMPPAAVAPPQDSKPEPMYPSLLPRDLPSVRYEVANSGFKRAPGFSIQLQPSPYGLLSACEINHTICVYMQTADEASADLTRQGLLDIFRLIDHNGNPLPEFPQGYLRVSSVQPAICERYGENLTLVTKGTIKAIPLSRTYKT